MTAHQHPCNRWGAGHTSTHTVGLQLRSGGTGSFRIVSLPSAPETGVYSWPSASSAGMQLPWEEQKASAPASPAVKSPSKSRASGGQGNVGRRVSQNSLDGSRELRSNRPYLGGERNGRATSTSSPGVVPSKRASRSMELDRTSGGPLSTPAVYPEWAGHSERPTNARY